MLNHGAGPRPDNHLNSLGVSVEEGGGSSASSSSSSLSQPPAASDDSDSGELTLMSNSGGVDVADAGSAVSDLTDLNNRMMGRNRPSGAGSNSAAAADDHGGGDDDGFPTMMFDVADLDPEDRDSNDLEQRLNRRDLDDAHADLILLDALGDKNGGGGGGGENGSEDAEMHVSFASDDEAKRAQQSSPSPSCCVCDCPDEDWPTAVRRRVLSLRMSVIVFATFTTFLLGAVLHVVFLAGFVRTALADGVARSVAESQRLVVAAVEGELRALEDPARALAAKAAQGAAWRRNAGFLTDPASPQAQSLRAGWADALTSLAGRPQRPLVSTAYAARFVNDGAVASVRRVAGEDRAETHIYRPAAGSGFRQDGTRSATSINYGSVVDVVASASQSFALAVNLSSLSAVSAAPSPFLQGERNFVYSDCWNRTFARAVDSAATKTATTSPDVAWDAAELTVLPISSLGGSGTTTAAAAAHGQGALLRATGELAHLVSAAVFRSNNTAAAVAALSANQQLQVDEQFALVTGAVSTVSLGARLAKHIGARGAQAFLLNGRDRVVAWSHGWPYEVVSEVTRATALAGRDAATCAYAPRSETAVAADDGVAHYACLHDFAPFSAGAAGGLGDFLFTKADFEALLRPLSAGRDDDGIARALDVLTAGGGEYADYVLQSLRGVLLTVREHRRQFASARINGSSSPFSTSIALGTHPPPNIGQLSRLVVHATELRGGPSNNDTNTNFVLVVVYPHEEFSAAASVIRRSIIAPVAIVPVAFVVIFFFVFGVVTRAVENLGERLGDSPWQSSPPGRQLRRRRQRRRGATREDDAAAAPAEDETSSSSSSPWLTFQELEDLEDAFDVLRSTVRHIASFMHQNAFEDAAALLREDNNNGADPANFDDDDESGAERQAAEARILSSLLAVSPFDAVDGGDKAPRRTAHFRSNSSDEGGGINNPAASSSALSPTLLGPMPLGYSSSATTMRGNARGRAAALAAAAGRTASVATSGGDAPSDSAPSGGGGGGTKRKAVRFAEQAPTAAAATNSDSDHAVASPPSAVAEAPSTNDGTHATLPGFVERFDAGNGSSRKDDGSPPPPSPLDSTEELVSPEMSARDSGGDRKAPPPSSDKRPSGRHHHHHHNHRHRDRAPSQREQHGASPTTAAPSPASPPVLPPTGGPGDGGTKISVVNVLAVAINFYHFHLSVPRLDELLARSSVIVTHMAAMMRVLGASLIEFRGDHFLFCVRIKSTGYSKLVTRLLQEVMNTAQRVAESPLYVNNAKGKRFRSSDESGGSDSNKKMIITTRSTDDDDRDSVRYDDDDDNENEQEGEHRRRGSFASSDGRDDSDDEDASTNDLAIAGKATTAPPMLQPRDEAATAAAVKSQEQQQRESPTSSTDGRTSASSSSTGSAASAAALQQKQRSSSSTTTTAAVAPAAVPPTAAARKKKHDGKKAPPVDRWMAGSRKTLVLSAGVSHSNCRIHLLSQGNSSNAGAASTIAGERAPTDVADHLLARRVSILGPCFADAASLERFIRRHPSVLARSVPVPHVIAMRESHLRVLHGAEVELMHETWDFTANGPHRGDGTLIAPRLEKVIVEQQADETDENVLLAAAAEAAAGRRSDHHHDGAGAAAAANALSEQEQRLILERQRVRHAELQRAVTDLQPPTGVVRVYIVRPKRTLLNTPLHIPELMEDDDS